MKDIKIIHGTIVQAVKVLNHIPEFGQFFTADWLEKRLTNSEHFILLATADDMPVGCKIAYDRYGDGSVYSWMGGVFPSYRKMGLAQLLLDKLEQLSKEKGYSRLVFKTWQKHEAMIAFAKKNHFQIIQTIEKNNPEENRIVFQKELL